MAKRNHRLTSTIVLSCVLMISVMHLSSMPALAQEGTAKGSSQPILLQLSAHGAATGIRPKLITWMAEEIGKRTEGRVSIKINWQADMAFQKNLLKETMTGNINMAVIDVADYSDQLFTWSVFNTFLTGPKDAAIVSGLKRDCFEKIPAFDAELKKWNLRRITFFNYLPSAISFSTPIDSIKDLKDKRVRAPSNWLQKMLTAAGSSQVALPWGDVYTALERGAIDGTLASLDIHYSYSMDAVSKYFLFNRKQWQPQPILVTINLDTWKRIPKEDREKILDVGKRVNTLENNLSPDYWDLCINEMTLRSKVVFKKMPDKELKSWADFPEVKSLSEVWITKAMAAGLPGKEIYTQVREIIDAGRSLEENK